MEKENTLYNRTLEHPGVSILTNTFQEKNTRRFVNWHETQQVESSLTEEKLETQSPASTTFHVH